MRCIRFEEPNGNKRIGFIDGDVVRTVYGSLDTFWRITDEEFKLSEIKLLAPCVPKQIICVGFNYRQHAEEFHAEVPKEPMLFSKRRRIRLSATGKRLCTRGRAKRLFTKQSWAW